jgi:Spy/CpxP family protein refolding chaperone
MKTSVRFMAVAIALFVVAQAAMAQNQDGQRGQRGQGRFGGGGGGGGFDPAQQLLRNEAVVKELEITDDQKQQITKFAEDSRESFRDLFSGDLSQEEVRAKMREVTEKAKKKMDEILLPHQKDRLAELVIQFQGPRALTTNTAVAEKLNLSQEQKDKLGEVLGRGGFGGGRQRGEGRGNNAEGGEQLSREERNKKALDVLTAEQKDQFEKMQGKKSEAVAEMRANQQRGGFGGRGGEGRGRGEGRGGEGRGRGEGRGNGEGRGEGKAPRDA